MALKMGPIYQQQVHAYNERTTMTMDDTYTQDNVGVVDEGIPR